MGGCKKKYWGKVRRSKANITSRAVEADNRPREVREREVQTLEIQTLDGVTQTSKVQTSSVKTQADGPFVGKRGDLMKVARNGVREGYLEEGEANAVISLLARDVISYKEADEIIGAFGVLKERPDENVEEYPTGKYETLDKVSIPHYEKLVNEVREKGETERERLFDGVKEFLELTSAEIKLELNIPLSHEVSLEVLREEIEQNEQVTLEKVKQFLKENGLALAGVSIMLASFVTAVVSLVKSRMRAAKSAGNKVSDAFKELAKKLGPVLGPLFSLAGSVFGLLAKGAGWLSKNLWVLFLFVAYLVYDYGKWKFQK